MLTIFDFIRTSNEDVGEDAPWRSQHGYQRLYRCVDLGTLGPHNYLGNPYQAVRVTMQRSPAMRHAAEVSAPLPAPAELRHRIPCRLRFRGRGTTPTQQGAITFFTACQIRRADENRFLEQFSAASAFLARQPGFMRFRLYEGLAEDSLYRFINMALWRSVSEFVAAFQSEEFKGLIRGGFDVTSHIIVAQ